MYRADQPYSSSAYSCLHGSPRGSASSSPQQLDRCCRPLTSEDGCHPQRSCQSTVVDGMSRVFDSGGCKAWVLSGRLKVPDTAGLSSYRGEVDSHSHKDALSRTCHWRSASPSDELDTCPAVFDVHCQRHVRQIPADVSRSDLIMGPSIHTARLLDVDRYVGGHGDYDATVATSPQFYYAAPRPSRQQWNCIEHQRQHDRSSPEVLSSSRLDLLPRSNYNDCNCASSGSGNPRQDMCDYSKVNGHACDGVHDNADQRHALCNGFRRPDSGGAFGRVSPVVPSNLTSPSRLDVSSAVSPRLEAHELSLSCVSAPLSAASKTPRRSISSSSSSSSSSTPNIIRRRLKTIAQSLDVRLSALGGGRGLAALKSRTSRHEPVSTHGKQTQTLARSNSEPEALDRVAGVQRGSAGDDEFGFSNSYPSYRIQAVRNQQDDEPPSPTMLVGRSSADGGAAGWLRSTSTVDDAVTSSKCSTDGKASRSTTKAGPRLAVTGGRWNLFSLMSSDNTLPKVCHVFFTHYQEHGVLWVSPEHIDLVTCVTADSITGSPIVVIKFYAINKNDNVTPVFVPK